ncbi:MAG: DUF4190 domain-containing protein [Sedimentisphaerales bacterium]
MKNDTRENSVQKPKTSRLAIASIVLAILSLLFPPVAILAIILAKLSTFNISKSAGLLKGRHLAVAAIVTSATSMVLWTMVVVLWRIDASPLPNDYTIADLRSAPRDCDPSYELIKSLSYKADNDSNDAPAIGLSEQDIAVISELKEVFKEADWTKIHQAVKENETDIIQAWQNAKKERDVIAKLATFPEIADLTDPSFELNLPWLKNVRNLAFLHRAYVCLQSCQENDEIAIEELLKLDNFIRKMNLNARSLVTKLVCMACFVVNIQTANFIINNPQTTRESVELLAQHFTPLTNEDIYLRNSIIFDYLSFKKELRKISTKSRLKYAVFSPLRLNSSFRVHRNYCDNWMAAEENRHDIEELSVWPAIYPELPITIDPNGNFPWYYKAYNPIGSKLVGILTPALNRVSQIKTKIQIRSDLLQMVLNQRLSKEISLKALAYSDEYIIDVENKKIFSPGPDGIPHNEDDIKLIINPQVLNFTD